MIFRLLIFIALSAAACAPLTLLSSDGGESITAGTDGGHLAEHTRIAFSPLPVASSRATDEIVGVTGEPGELYAMSKDADVFRSAGISFAKWLWLNKTGMARDVLKVGSVTAFLFDDEIMTCGTPCTTTLSEFQFPRAESRCVEGLLRRSMRWA